MGCSFLYVYVCLCARMGVGKIMKEIGKDNRDIVRSFNAKLC